MEKSNSIADSKQVNIFVFLLIYFSGSTVLFGTSTLSVFIQSVVPDLIILLICIHYLRKRGFRLPLNKCILFIVLTLSLLVVMIVNRDFSLNNIYEVVQLFIALMVSSIFEQSEFEKAFTKSMIVICAFSLITYALRLTIPTLTRLFPVIYNTAGVSFNFLGLSIVPTNYLGNRNFAIFREPGVFVCFICFAYILGKKNNLLTKANCAIFFLALLSTLSTTGYIALFAIILSIILEKKSFNHFIVSLVGGIVFFIILYTRTNLLDVDGPLFSKILVHSSSYNARFGSVEQNIALIRRYPIFGSGWNNMKEFFLSSTLSSHNTNTILYFFSCYGLVVGFIYTFGLLRSFYINQGKLLSYLLLAVLILVLFGERICFDISLLTLVFYGISDFFIKKKKPNNAFSEI